MTDRCPEINNDACPEMNHDSCFKMNNEWCFDLKEGSGSFQQFCADIHSTRLAIRQAPCLDVLLFHSSSYQFSVGFFALALEGRHIVLPPNAQAETLHQVALQCQASLGDIAQPNLHAINKQQQEGESHAALPVMSREALFEPIDCKITFFTSGSTGQAKAVSKQFGQLNSEIDILIETFTDRITSAQVLVSTVSHQHIYGLLFKVLLPLKTGLTIVNETFEYPEHISNYLAQDRTVNALLISSPAHLKRLGLDNVLVQNQAQLQGIYSSGGPLAFDTAQLLFKQLGQAPIEIFGSTETGGIAWRQCDAPTPSPWQVFPGISYAIAPETAQLVLTSPYISEENYVTEDRVLALDSRHFELLGRADRTIKHEEKRINLNHMERCLREHPMVDEARIVVLSGANRQVLGAVIELSPEALLATKAKKSLNELFKTHLLGEFERICLPRKWRYPERMPFNAQGKLVMKELEKLFD